MKFLKRYIFVIVAALGVFTLPLAGMDLKKSTENKKSSSEEDWLDNDALFASLYSNNLNVKPNIEDNSNNQDSSSEYIFFSDNESDDADHGQPNESSEGYESNLNVNNDSQAKHGERQSSNSHSLTRFFMPGIVFSAVVSVIAFIVSKVYANAVCKQIDQLNRLQVVCLEQMELIKAEMASSICLIDGFLNRYSRLSIDERDALENRINDFNVALKGAYYASEKNLANAMPVDTEMLTEVKLLRKAFDSLNELCEQYKQKLESSPSVVEKVGVRLRSLW